MLLFRVLAIPIRINFFDRVDIDRLISFLVLLIVILGVLGFLGSGSRSLRVSCFNWERGRRRGGVAGFKRSGDGVKSKDDCNNHGGCDEQQNPRSGIKRLLFDGLSGRRCTERSCASSDRSRENRGRLPRGSLRGGCWRRPAHANTCACGLRGFRLGRPSTNRFTYGCSGRRGWWRRRRIGRRLLIGRDERIMLRYFRPRGSLSRQFRRRVLPVI